MNLFSIYADKWQLIDENFFLMAAIIFFAGVFCAPIVVRRQVSWLMRYPIWIWGLIKKHIDLGAPFLKLWALIFFLNAFSLFCNAAVGFSIVLPPIFAFLLGINIAVIALKEMGTLRLAILILNPVSVFELPAAWISLALGMGLGRDLYLNNYTNAIYLAERYLMGYFILVLPLLAVAGFIEVLLIKALGRKTASESEFEEKEARNNERKK